MSERVEKIIVCDYCKKEISDGGKQYFGGHPFHGWITVRVHNFSTRLEDLQRKRSFDFCSETCLLNHYKI